MPQAMLFSILLHSTQEIGKVVYLWFSGDCVHLWDQVLSLSRLECPREVLDYSPKWYWGMQFSEWGPF